MADLLVVLALADLLRPRPSRFGRLVLWLVGKTAGRPAEATTDLEHITHPVVNGHRVVTLRDNGHEGTR